MTDGTVMQQRIQRLTRWAFNVIARVAPARFRPRIESIGAHAAAHSFADAAVIVTLFHDAGVTFAVVVIVVGVALVIAVMEA
jgi:hypothetical protein